MATHAFSYKQALSFGFDTYKKYPWFLSGITLFIIAVSVLPSFFGQVLDDLDMRAYMFVALIVVWIMYYVLQFVLRIGYIDIAITHMRGKKAHFDTLFLNLPRVIWFILGSWIYGIITLVGFILLIVPGVIWGIQFQFFPFFMVDKKYGVFKALDASSHITKGVKWQLFVFNVLIVLVNIVGFLCLGFGILITLPATTIALAKVYDTLLDRAKTTA